ncbi:MAG: cytochrome c biogenesis protein ResB [Planctomycetes bacterium]|nr:cytochrome c biogenesis protein ResB [Planctomycetota bacterium]
MSALRRVALSAIGVLSSFGLACALFVLLGLLTWLGTLEQAHTGLYDVQRKYFESYALVHDAGGVPIPLPGANLVLSLLALNLVLGGIVRLRRSRETVGILVAHLGILLLLGAGLVKHRASDDGRVTLYEGQSASWFESDYRWELAVRERHPDGTTREHVTPFDGVLLARDEAPVTVEVPGAPFSLEVREAHSNSRPFAAVDDGGPSLRPLARDPETPRNLPGARVALVWGGAPLETLVWGAQSAPFGAVVDGRRFEIDLRRERHALPFTLTLEDFRKVDHPRSNMPRSFESDVVVDGDRRLTISMNEPLRQGGVVVYQASWGPQGAGPGARLFSTFAVVRNPADQLPLVACLVIAAGLVGHFGRRLARHMRLEGCRR